MLRKGDFPQSPRPLSASYTPGSALLTFLPPFPTVAHRGPDAGVTPISCFITSDKVLCVFEDLILTRSCAPAALIYSSKLIG